MIIWTSVKDALPPDRTEIVMSDGTGVMTGWYNVALRMWNSSGDFPVPIEPITHWAIATLPEAQHE